MDSLVTVVIPTHERHHLIETNILPHYKGFGAPVLIVDSSRNPCMAAKETPWVDYVHCPGAPIPHKLKAPVLERIETPYAFMCADDSVHSFSGSKRCIDFLKDNPDYASAMGLTFGCQYPDRSVVYSTDYDILSMPTDSPVAGERLLQVFARFRSLFYSVMRTQTLKDVFRYLPEEIVNYYLMETYIVLMVAASGKHATLPVAYEATAAGPSINDQDSRYHCSPFKLATHERYAGEVAATKRAVAEYLMELSGISEERAMIYVNGALALYWLQDKPIKSLQDRILNEWNSFLNKTFHKSQYKKMNADKKVRQKLLNEKVHAKNLALLSPEDLAEYEHLIRIIQKA
ncbi:TIGR00180 family glycosyltransferase [Pseudodesulfovibrio sp. F-1]|uniref:TIGR00180 family glycosyltransferase n=1 Tax=Pseudodesulfovibrio alkaliphilus TaxID=2661613 RepID=A0A7K1KPT4_9BACT|nr:TIGR00180 family glycosyltransferase [Pseudodesulfovibrio alkaliphilus]MUM78103.1 TIGR00180 family glycosyltransferase [Pseudodesulfovibrio alkaliphilus]